VHHELTYIKVAVFEAQYCCAEGCANLKGTIMKIDQIALLAGLGMVAMTLPASAAPATTDSADVRAAKPAYTQLAQNATRAASEARGGDFKKPKKAKKRQKK
jgi:hypothetical protein